MSTTQVADNGHVKEQAKEAAGQVREQAGEAARKASDRVRSQLDERSTDMGDRVVSQAGDVRTIGSSLREQGNDSAAQLADQAAERIEQVGSWLRDSDADRMLEQAEDVARRKPWVVLAGSVAVGFAISRVLKASSTDRHRSRSANGASDPYGSTAASSAAPSGRFDRVPPPAQAPVPGMAPAASGTPSPATGPGTGMGLS